MCTPLLDHKYEHLTPEPCAGFKSSAHVTFPTHCKKPQEHDSCEDKDSRRSSIAVLEFFIQCGFNIGGNTWLGWSSMCRFMMQLRWLVPRSLHPDVPQTDPGNLCHSSFGVNLWRSPTQGFSLHAPGWISWAVGHIHLWTLELFRVDLCNS